jgi:hypothetical protein
VSCVGNDVGGVAESSEGRLQVSRRHEGMSVCQHLVDGFRPTHVLLVRQCDDETSCVHDPSEDHLSLGRLGLGQELWDRQNVVPGKGLINLGVARPPDQVKRQRDRGCALVRIAGIKGPKNVVQVAVEAREVVVGGIVHCEVVCLAEGTHFVDRSSVIIYCPLGAQEVLVRRVVDARIPVGPADEVVCQVRDHLRNVAPLRWVGRPPERHSQRH